jgi:mannose-6-phosphate isomerase
VQTRGQELLGRAVCPDGSACEQFPLLVKFLDANDALSVQVHPDDERGQRLAGDSGKTEAWVIIHAEPGSLIYAGLEPGVTRGAFAAAMRLGDIEPLLHQFPARAGDCIMVPAGTVHAIGAGVLLVEVQQMSDATFRVYDWGRVGADGRPRALHPDEALESIDFSLGAVNPVRPTVATTAGGARERLCASPYFALERLRLTSAGRIGRPDRFTIIVGLGGEAELRAGRNGNEALTRIPFGETILLPAAVGECDVEPLGGEAVLLTCVVP